MYRFLQVLQNSLPYQGNLDVNTRTNEVIAAMDRTLITEGFEEGEGDELDTAVNELQAALDEADAALEEADDDDGEPVEVD